MQQAASLASRVVAHLISQWAESFGAKLVKVLVEVLIREIGAQEHALDLAVGPGKLCKCALPLPLLQVLQEAPKYKTRRRAAHDALAGEFKRKRVCVGGGNLLQSIHGRFVGELDLAHE